MIRKRSSLGGRPAGVHEWRVLTVDRRGLAVRVRRILVGIEYLHLVSPHQEYAAVAALLPFAARRHRRHPFDVQLAVAEPLARPDVATARGDLGVAVLD